MSEKKKLVIVLTHGLHDERSSVAWSVANGGLNSGLDVTLFLTSSAVDHVRKGAADQVHLNPLDPSMKEMVNNAISKGAKIIVCPPCAKVRGYEQEDLLDGIVLAGSPAIHELIKEGAATLSF